MVQQKKVEDFARMRESLKDYSSFVFADYRGMNVDQMTGLRKNLRAKGAEFHVIKNRLVKRVLHELGREGLDDFLVDPTALVFSNADFSEIVKVLVEAGKETTLKLKGGYSEGSALDTESIERISKLPTKIVLIAQAIGLLNTPISGLVFTLNGVLTKAVRVLHAVEEQKAKQTGA